MRMSNDDGRGTHGSRRNFVRLAAAGAIIGALPSCSKPRENAPVVPPAPEPAAATALDVGPKDAGRVRVVSVPTAVEGNVLPSLIADFNKTSGLRIELTSTDDVYGLARLGKADLAISHYGHKHAEQFVMDGFGEWPRTLFSNQMALLGPKSDPAKVRGLEDLGEAFRRIAQTRSPFVLNDIDGVRYLTELLWNVAGKPDRAGWLLDDRKFRKVDAIHLAEQKQAYVFWGLTPFLREKSTTLEPLVLGDALLQRMLVSIIVKPAKIANVNSEGALAFQTFLLQPETQARVRECRYPGDAKITWVPGGRHNRTAILPKG